MLQQPKLEKKENRTGSLGRLTFRSVESREAEKDLEYLAEDYEAMSRIAANLSSHARWIPYPFLRDRIRSLAEEVRALSELIRANILGLGGKVPQVALENRDVLEFRQNVMRLVRDMEEHSNQSEIFVHQKNKIENKDVVKMIGHIILRMQVQKEELMDIVMRLS